MTVHTTTVMTSHIADGEITEFSFNFRLILEEDVTVFLDSVPVFTGYIV